MYQWLRIYFLPRQLGAREMARLGMENASGPDYALLVLKKSPPHPIYNARLTLFSFIRLTGGSSMLLRVTRPSRRSSCREALPAYASKLTVIEWRPPQNSGTNSTNELTITFKRRRYFEITSGCGNKWAGLIRMSSSRAHIKH